MHGKTDVDQPRRQGRLRRPAASASRSSATTRWRSSARRCRRRSRSPSTSRATARSWACATASCGTDAARRRAVPPRVDPHRARPRDAANFLEASDERAVDLRSDTVTRPTRGDARRDGARAEVGDDVFGDDPTVNALQERIAGAARQGGGALRAPAARRATWCAIMSHCGRGDEYIVGQMAHTYRYEGGGAAVLGSVQPQPLEHEADGSLALADDRGGDQARRRALRAARRLLVPREHARRQGAAARLPRGGDARSRSGAASRPISTARASSTPRSRCGVAGGATIAAPFDSVSVCLSQGPGRAGRLGAASARREFIAARAPLAQDARRRHAPGRRARRRRAARARAPRRPPRRRPRAAPRGWPTGLAGPARPDGRAAADQHRLRRPRRASARRA